MDINKEFDFMQWIYDLQPKKCVGCECASFEFAHMGDAVWVCELDECYLGDDSYNPEWHKERDNS